MKLFGAVVLLLSLQLTTGNQRSARVECYDNGDDYSMVFTVVVNSDPDANYVYALNSTDGKVEECASDSVPSLFTTTAEEFTIQINVTKGFLAADASCGHTNTGEVFEWRFLTTKFSSLVVKSVDILYVAKCNFSDATPSYVTTSVVVTGEPVENLTPDESITFALQIVDQNDQSLASVAIGTMVSLKIVQTGGRDVTPTGTDCWASPDGVFDNNGEYQLIAVNGCPASGFVSAGFTGTTRSATAGTMEQFQFVASATVYYKCTVRYCLGANTACNDICTSNGRRKRQASDVESSEASTYIAITAYGQQQKSTSQESPPEKDEETLSCLNNVGVLVAMGVMGGLLLLSILVSVMLFVRASRLIEKQKM